MFEFLNGILPLIDGGGGGCHVDHVDKTWNILNENHFSVKHGLYMRKLATYQTEQNSDY